MVLPIDLRFVTSPTVLVLGAAFFVSLALSGGGLNAREPATTRQVAPDEAFNSTVWPVIQEHCIDCHGQFDPESGVSFHGLESPSDVLENRDTWEMAFKQLRIDGMPPRDYDPRPSPEEREAFVRWLERKLYHVDCDLVDDVGRVTIHRLNRTEYDNTIRDLLGVDIHAAADFPSDDVGYGFSNIGDVLSLGPLLFEKYVDASERIAEAALDNEQLVFTRPSKKKSAEEAAGEILHRLMPRAFRRPVDEGEVERMVRLVELAVGRGASFERGVQVALQAILVSPHFLFRIEYDAEPGNAAVQHRISDHELASRLSYFLWSSMPDEPLFRLADQGRLHHPRVLDAQIARMLASPKAEALVENFASQWLNLSNLEEVVPAAELFPTFTPELRADMVRETQAVARTIFRDDLSLLAFLDADFTFVNARLAKHYGIDGVKGDRLRRVSLPAGERAGVLTHASILTLTSNPNRTSLVRRGKWILDNILGVELPDQPPDIPSLEDGAKESGAATLREQLALHRAMPTCSVCHDTLDPLGFGFENFDAIGRWRETSEGLPVDSSGTLPDGQSFRGPIELVRILKGRETEFAELVTRKMLTYALGRGLERPDSCLVEEIVADLEKNDYRFSVLVRGIVHGSPFLMRRGEEGGEK